MMAEEAAVPVSNQEAEAAYRQVADEIEQLAPERVLAVNGDIPRMVTHVLAHEPRIAALQATIAVQCPGFSLVPVTRLRTYALAAFHAHAIHVPPTNALSPMKPLLDEALPLKEELLVWAEPLVHAGYFDAAQVAEIRSGQGYHDLAVDLATLGELYGKNWSRIKGKVGIKQSQIAQAGRLASSLIQALGKREEPEATGPINPTADRRARAYTLMVNAYGQCRRVVLFLRWEEGDADEIAPSLFKGRGGRKPASTAPAEPVVEPAAPATSGG